MATMTSLKAKSHARTSRRGFTLIELMVSTAIGLFVIAATVSLLGLQSRVQTQATSRMEMDESARLATDLIIDDLAHAGLGVGYSSSDAFFGLRLGAFSVRGGAAFNSRNFSVDLGGEARPTDDIGIRMADGDFRTIASASAGGLEICAGAKIKDGDVVVLMSQGYVFAKTVLASGLTSGVCTSGQCQSGCDVLTISNDPFAFLSDEAALGASYQGGELAAGFKEVVWFVVPDQAGTGTLRRAAVTEAEKCDARDESCGQWMVSDVETIQMRVMQWSDAGWQDRTEEDEITGRERLRVDVEVVVRSRVEDSRPHDPVVLGLEDGACLPTSCSSDRIARRVIRQSTEIRNSGYMLVL